MPRYVSSQIRWSVREQGYVLSAGERETRLEKLAGDWLEEVASFSFHGREGIHYTVRKQKVQRGGSYWYGYRRLHERIVKRYLGRTPDLTLARLEEVAALLDSEPVARQPVLPQPQTALLPQMAQAEVQRVIPAGTPPPLLLSRLAPPRLHPRLLERPRLFALLDAGLASPFTLVSAPAGSGKTTLLCQWMTARRNAGKAFPPVAWLSLETADNDPLRFWHYLSAACQAFQADLTQVQAALAAEIPQPPFLHSSLETVLTALLNALNQDPAGGILVLEDYHVISEGAIHTMLAFLLEHLPAHFHLLLITRSDPPFALARLRARNLLHEIRAADLSFSLDETAMLLRQELPFQLEEKTIQRLHAQLEGWSAGLHLLKIALQRASTPEEGEQALALFSHANTSFQEYFVSEVLDAQPAALQAFLLQTSILSRLSAALCDAVTEREDGQELLTRLERAHLFLEPLGCSASTHSPENDQWYRYHALFAEAMRSEARSRFGEVFLRQLCSRASYWYEAHGYAREAIDAALDAQEYARAANLIEHASEESAPPGEIHEPHTLQRWFEQLPATLLARHPILCVSYATTQLFASLSWLPGASTLRSLEKLLRGAEEDLRATQNLPKLGELLAFRALLALRQNNPAAALQYAKEALPCFGQNRHIWRGLSLSIVAEEWITAGDLRQARTALLEAYTLCEAAENHYFKRITMIKLAHISFEQGEAQQAMSLYRQVLTSAREDEQAYTLCNALCGLAALAYECNELASATRYAQEAITASQARQMLYYEVRATLMLVRVHQAQEQIFVAQQQLAALLDRVPVSLPGLVQEIQTARARLALATGDQATVQHWAAARRPHPDFSQEIEEKGLLCRWLRIQGKLAEAAREIECLLDAALETGHTRRVLEILVEKVLLLAARKQKTEAQQLLREVLARALGEQVTRLFLDAGEQMANLLRTLLPQLHEPALLSSIRALLNAFPGQTRHGEQSQTAALLEPLSPQEMRVLRLLVLRRSNAEIASELVVSVNTVRTQVQSIYNKLGVHTRSAASEVARELRLIS